MERINVAGDSSLGPSENFKSVFLKMVFADYRIQTGVAQQ